MTGVERIAAERQRQIDVEGYAPAHDAAHTSAELARAAASYVAAAVTAIWTGFQRRRPLEKGPLAWPWEPAAWNPAPDPIRNLEKAGALCAAEIDRLLAEAAAAADEETP